MRIKFMKCPHIKCGARMQRLYVRDPDKKFVPVGWRCPECGVMMNTAILPRE